MWTTEEALSRDRTEFEWWTERENRETIDGIEWEMVEETQVMSKLKRAICVEVHFHLSRSDSEKIRKEITQQKDEEKQLAIEEIRKQKQKDLSAAQRRIEELEQQVIEARRGTICLTSFYPFSYMRCNVNYLLNTKNPKKKVYRLCRMPTKINVERSMNFKCVSKISPLNWNAWRAKFKKTCSHKTSVGKRTSCSSRLRCSVARWHALF